MTSRRASGVGPAALAALLGALSLAGCRGEPAAPTPLLPGFVEALPGLDRVELEQGDQRFVLLRDGEHWRIEGAGWRADRRWLQPLLLGLAEARCDEPRTADPGRFARIGVAWPPASAVAEGEAFARPTGRVSLSLGGQVRQVVVGYPPARGGTFVRVEGAPHSCLTRTDLRLPARAADWFDPRLWAPAPAPPAAVTIQDRAALPLLLLRQGEHYLADGQAVALSPLADGLVAALLAPRQVGLRALAADRAEAERVLRFESPVAAEYTVALRREADGTWAEVLAAPAGQGADFAGREFLLPPDVAEPLWASRGNLGGSGE
jgi:hypothetical protein